MVCEIKSKGSHSISKSLPTDVDVSMIFMCEEENAIWCMMHELYGIPPPVLHLAHTYCMLPVDPSKCPITVKVK